MRVECFSVIVERLGDRIIKRVWHIVDFLLDEFKRRKEDCVNDAGAGHRNAQTYDGFLTISNENCIINAWHFSC